MKTKYNIKFLVILIISVAFLLMLSTKVEAASATIKCEPETVEVGKPVKITVTGTGVQWSLKLMVDGQQIASNSELDNYESNKTISFSGTYTPTSTGNKNVTLQGSVTEFSDGSTITSFGSKTIVVNEAKTGNNTDNNTGGSNTTQEEPKGSISSCKINGITVKEFLNVTNKDSVSVTVTTSTGEGLKIYNNLTKKTVSASSGKTVTVPILEGTNTLTITLNSGATATRKIYSQKEEEVKPNVIEEPEEKEEVKVALKSLMVKGVKSEDETIELSFTPEFSSEVYEYKILLDETLADITKLEIEAIALQDDFTVEIEGNEELKDGENTVTIIVKSKDGETTATYKILVTKEVEVVPISAPTVEVEQEVIQPLWNRTQQILITIFTSIIALMGIAFAIIEYRYKKEPTVKIPKPETTLEEDMEKEVEEDKVGEIPFAKIGFEKEEDNKVDILKEESQPEFKDLKEQKNEIEEELKKQTKRRGKHF